VTAHPRRSGADRRGCAAGAVHICPSRVVARVLARVVTVESATGGERIDGVFPLTGISRCHTM